MSLIAYISAGSACVAAAGLGYTVYSGVRARSKCIAYSVSVGETLASSGFRDTVETRVGGNRFKDLREVRVQVVNIGRNELKTEDIDTAPTVTVPGATVLQARITLHRPDTPAHRVLSADMLAEPTIEAPRKTLNPKDSLEFHLLISGDAEEPQVFMQAAGFRFIRMSSSGSSRR